MSDDGPIRAEELLFDTSCQTVVKNGLIVEEYQTCTLRSLIVEGVITGENGIFSRQFVVRGGNS